MNVFNNLLSVLPKIIFLLSNPKKLHYTISKHRMTGNS